LIKGKNGSRLYIMVLCAVFTNSKPALYPSRRTRCSLELPPLIHRSSHSISQVNTLTSLLTPLDPSVHLNKNIQNVPNISRSLTQGNKNRERRQAKHEVCNADPMQRKKNNEICKRRPLSGKDSVATQKKDVLSSNHAYLILLVLFHCPNCCGGGCSYI
jgi:hypothetical protein